MIPKTPIGKFDKQGHRGCRALMPENTIPAMITAIDLGVTTLELDVVITKDERVIVSHEPFFNHEISTKPNGAHVEAVEEKLLNIYQMTFLQTTEFDVGLKPHPRFPMQKKMRISKPLLTQLIDSIEAYCSERKLEGPNYNIETKCLPQTDNVYHPPPEKFIGLLMRVIEAKKISDRVTIQSFDIRTLQEVHKHYPSVATALLIDEDNLLSLQENLHTLGFIPTIYSPHHSLVTAQLIKNCHAKRIRIIPWTVNDKNQILDFKRLGVDGIITDDPNLFN